MTESKKNTEQNEDLKEKRIYLTRLYNSTIVLKTGISYTIVPIAGNLHISL